jgi:hypothetical protein
MALSPSEFNKIKKETVFNTQKQMLGKYSKKEEVEMPKGADRAVKTDGSEQKVQLEPQPRSLFSKHHLFYLKTAEGGNYPITEEEVGNNTELFKNVTPLDLCSKDLGGLIYRPNDFLYLKDINTVPMNRLITLNKFAYPCGDNITNKEFHTEPPIATMLSFATDEYNKLSEILSMSFGMRWKELESEFEKMELSGDPSGFGGTGKIKSMMAIVSPEFGSNAIQGQNRLNIDPYHDQNKTHGAVDVVAKTNIREIGLDFENAFEIEFRYVVRSHQGISQKAAFVDLLSNIFLMATQDATFWGGARYYVGQRPSKMAMNQKFMNPRDYNEFISGGTSAMKSFLGGLGGAGTIDTLKAIGKNILNMALGKMLDTVGRPAIPFSNSLLTNDPTGMYHLVIGNPLNPILTIGNLMNDGMTSLKFGDTLGNEDFPTEVFATFKLKPAMPRGRAGIESMFNNGARTYWKPKDVMGKNTGGGSSATNPSLIDSFIQQGAESIFEWGSYTKDAVLRNSQSVYKYVKGND